MRWRGAVAGRAAVVGFMLLPLAAAVAGCGSNPGDLSDQSGLGMTTHTLPTHSDPSPSPHPDRSSTRAARPSSPVDDDSARGVTGAELGDSLSYGALEVRVTGYRKAGYAGAATGTRVDVVTVDECASGSSARVQHRSWRVLDSSGRTLGRAGGKIVNGNPTEDLPETLGAGQCLTTDLAFGVPAGSTPVAVADGPDDTWLLAD